jgi:hypothetical protein
LQARERAQLLDLILPCAMQHTLGFAGELLAKNASDIRMARAVVANHKTYLIFRRSLRHLS